LAIVSGLGAVSGSLPDVFVPVAGTAGGVAGNATLFGASMIVSDGPVDWFTGTVDGTAIEDAAAGAGDAAPAASRRPVSWTAAAIATATTTPPPAMRSQGFER
jgi:hypothetical protein